jgi:hypothetical protein
MSPMSGSPWPLTRRRANPVVPERAMEGGNRRGVYSLVIPTPTVRNCPLTRSAPILKSHET